MILFVFKVAVGGVTVEISKIVITVKVITTKVMAVAVAMTGIMEITTT